MVEKIVMELVDQMEDRKIIENPVETIMNMF